MIIIIKTVIEIIIMIERRKIKMIHEKRKERYGVKVKFQYFKRLPKDIWKKKNIKLKEMEIIDHYLRNGQMGNTDSQSSMLC